MGLSGIMLSWAVRHPHLWNKLLFEWKVYCGKKVLNISIYFLDQHPSQESAIHIWRFISLRSLNKLVKVSCKALLWICKLVFPELLRASLLRWSVLCSRGSNFLMPRKPQMHWSPKILIKLYVFMHKYPKIFSEKKYKVWYYRVSVFSELNNCLLYCQCSVAKANLLNY